MAIQEVEINGKKYTADVGDDGQYLSPPIPAGEEKPEVVTVNLLNDTAQTLFPHRKVLKAWLKDNPIANILFSKENVVINVENLNYMESIILEDKDDDTSPLTEETAQVLISIINNFKGNLKNAS